METSNFDFIRKHTEDLASLGRIAEKLLAVDLPSAVTKLRLLAETATRFIYEEYQIFKPYQANFNDLLINDEFVQTVPPAINNKLHFIRKKGNDAAHGDPSKITQQVGIETLKQSFDITKWIYAIFFTKDSKDLPVFQVPQLQLEKNLAKEKKALEARLKEFEAETETLIEEIKAKEKALEEAQKQLDKKSDEEKQKLKESGKKVADHLGFDEAETRSRLINTMLEDAGWDVSDPDQVGIEVKVKHQPTDSGVGYVDYVLWGDEGEPLAIVEAKKTSVSHKKGQEQARFYAEGFEKEFGKRPVIFYTNGFETSIWEGPSSRRVFGFYSKDSLQYLIFQRVNKEKNVEACNPNKDIAGRLYQINAIKKVAKRFQDNYRKALIVQATGTGKTRVAIAFCDLLLRTKWAKRILFICDRVELRKQAHDAFKEYLPGEPRIYASKLSRNDQSSRIYLATYPGMMGIYENFDIGFFDLIIADESHRSIYNKYRDLFLYFDSLQIGLTATPVKFINRNTYQLFGCEDKDPTCFFSLDEAINNVPPYLVPFRVKDMTTKFLREGIKYKNLTPKQQQKLEEEGEEAELFDYEAKQVDKSIFNKDTNRIILRNLMENGIKNEAGTLVGKSIIFARSQDHADLLQNLFVELYPQYGEAVCKTIYSGGDSNRTSSLIDEFKGLKGETRFNVALSVDMLDTGVDIPEVVNLVFAKPVKSYVKFWQMIGRGTRLCLNLFGPGNDKTEFLIFDHWGNFRFFEEAYKELEPPPTKSILSELFEQRISLAKAALDKSHAYGFDLGIELISADINDLPMSSVSVKEQLRQVEEMKVQSVLKTFTDPVQKTLNKTISPLMNWRVLKDIEAIKFDLLIAGMQIAVVEKSATLEQLKADLFERLNRLAVNINYVRSKDNLIKEIQTAEFWAKVEISTLENVRKELRGIMKFKTGGPGLNPPKITDILEEESGIKSIDRDPAINGLDEYVYRSRVEKILNELLETNPTLQKIRMDEPVTRKDIAALCSLVLTKNPGIDLELLTEFYPDSAGQLQLAIRALIGLDRIKVEDHFTEFVQAHPELTAGQVQFVSMLKNHISKYGFIKTGQLFEQPFTSLHSNGIDGVFEEQMADEIIDLLKIFHPPIGPPIKEEH